jgi:dipeptidase
VSAVANQFVIREIDPQSPDFLFSANIFDVAERNGFWSAADGKLLDFLTTYAPMRAHSPYATRRVWRVFNMGKWRFAVCMVHLCILHTAWHCHFYPTLIFNAPLLYIWNKLLVAPSIELPAFTDAYGNDYPFSVKADKPLHPTDIMKINRDHYEGTIFDLTKGLQAGPYGDPNRWVS